MDSTVNGFSNLHPLSNFIYFFIEIGVVMFCANPYLQLISIVCAVAYYFFLIGRWKIKKIAAFAFMSAMAAVINPLFSHQGATIITYFPDGNPFTLESVIYGIGMGMMLLASCVWFLVLNEVMTTEKWIHLFGKIASSLGLFFSLVLRFIPKMLKKQKEMKEYNAQESAVTRFSMLVTWGLETSVDTADSMAARGYGLEHRSSYGIYRFGLKDALFIALCLGFGTLFFLALHDKWISFYYYPTVQSGGTIPCYGILYVFFGIYSLLPLLLGIKENIKWNYLESKI